jgi:hypothetical protein
MFVGRDYRQHESVVAEIISSAENAMTIFPEDLEGDISGGGKP